MVIELQNHFPGLRVQPVFLNVLACADERDLDHERLSYYHNGIQRRLTDVHGHVIEEILA